MEFLPTKITDFEFRNGYFYKFGAPHGQASRATSALLVCLMESDI